MQHVSCPGGNRWPVGGFEGIHPPSLAFRYFNLIKPAEKNGRGGQVDPNVDERPVEDEEQEEEPAPCSSLMRNSNSISLSGPRIAGCLDKFFD